MNDELKKLLKRIEAEIRYGWHYVYATVPRNGDTYRFCFHPLAGKAEGELVSALKRRGLIVSMWRTKKG